MGKKYKSSPYTPLPPSPPPHEQHTISRTGPCTDPQSSWLTQKLPLVFCLGICLLTRSRHWESCRILSLTPNLLIAELFLSSPFLFAFGFDFWFFGFVLFDSLFSLGFCHIQTNHLVAPKQKLNIKLWLRPASRLPSPKLFKIRGDFRDESQLVPAWKQAGWSCPLRLRWRGRRQA